MSLLDAQFGDILCIKSKGFISKIIRLRTLSRINHVCFCLGEGKVADIRLFSTLKIRDIKEFEREKWALLRPISVITETQKAKIMEFIDHHMGTKYDVLAIIGIFCNLNLRSKNRMLCSNFIRRVFQSAGLEVLREKPLAAAYPELIFQSLFFRKIGGNL